MHLGNMSELTCSNLRLYSRAGSDPLSLLGNGMVGKMSW